MRCPDAAPAQGKNTICSLPPNRYRGFLGTFPILARIRPIPNRVIEAGDFCNPGERVCRRRGIGHVPKQVFEVSRRPPVLGLVVAHLSGIWFLLS